MASNCGPDSLGHNRGTRQIGLGQQNCKKLFCVSRRAVDVSQVTSQQHTHGPKDIVSGLCTALTSDMMESIWVHQQQTQRVRMALGPCRFDLEQLVKVTAVEQIGNWISDRALLNLRLHPLDFVG